MGKGIRELGGRAGGQIPQDAGELFGEKGGDGLGRMCGGSGEDAGLEEDGDLGAVEDALGDHEAVDAIGGEILHVAIEEAGAAPHENPLTIADGGADGGARALEGTLAPGIGAGAQGGMQRRSGGAARKLIWEGKLANSDLVLIGMAGPCAVHAASGLVVLILLEGGEGAGVKCWVFAAGIESSHTADGQQPMLVAEFGKKGAEILKKGDVVGDGIAVRKDPGGVHQIEMDEAGHVIPAAEIQAEEVIAQMEGEFLELVGEGMGFDEGHAFNGIFRQRAGTRDGLEEVTPPEGFSGGFGFGDIEGKGMGKSSEISLPGDDGHIEERGGEQFAGKHACLMEVKAAGAGEDHGL